MNFRLMWLAVVALIIGGCTSSIEAIKKDGTSTREDVFTEVAAGTGQPPATTTLTISCSVKTQHYGAYSIDRQNGDEWANTLLINIDGQAKRITGVMSTEKWDAQSLGDPEAGEGIRHRFRTTLRLEPGKHHITIALPEKDVVAEKEILLAPGSNLLQIEPSYRERTVASLRVGVTDRTSFKAGVKSLYLVLNGVAQ